MQTSPDSGRAQCVVDTNKVISMPHVLCFIWYQGDTPVGNKISTSDQRMTNFNIKKTSIIIYQILC